MHTPVPSDPHAAEPLRGLVHACLDDIDELIEAFLAELADLDPYRDEVIPWPEVRRDAEASFELLLRIVAGLPVPPRLSRVSERIGRRRAQAGVPLEVLLQAVRLDFRILWDALIRRAAPDDLAALLAGAVRVWDAVEQHTVGVHVSYLDEAAVLAREREQERSRLVAQLLATDGRDAHVRAQVATALEVDPGADFVVAVAASNQRPLRSAAERLRAQGIAAHLHQEDLRPILIAALPSGVRSVPPPWLKGVPCGLGPVASGLAAVARSVRVGTAIAEALDPAVDDARRLRSVWTEVVVDGLPELTDALTDELLSEVDRTTEHERRRLAETATTYFGTGSVAATAKSLFCHRNTVLNRLRRLGELTGCDLNRPDHAALVMFALRARHRSRTDSEV